jgi:WD40 repeat protein
MTTRMGILSELARLVAHSVVATGVAGAQTDKDVGIGDQAPLVRYAILKGAPDEIGEATFSPDGCTLATVSGNGIVQLWDVPSRTEKLTFKETVAHGQVRSPASKSRSERMRETVTPMQFAFAFSSDSQFLAALDRDANTHIWSARTGQEVMPSRKLSTSLPWGWPGPTVLFPAERPMAVGVSLVGLHPVKSTVRIWDLSTGTEFVPMRDRISRFSEFAVSHDGRLVAVGIDRGIGQPDGTVEVWDVVNGRRIAKVTTGSLDHNTLAFSHDDKTFVTVKGDRDVGANGWDFLVTAWDLTANVKMKSFKDSMKGRMYAAALSPDDKYLLGMMIDATIEVWNVSTGVRRAFQPNTIEPSMEIDESNFSRKGTLYFTYRRPPEAESVVIRDWWSRRTITSLEGQTLAVFSPDGHMLATAGFDRFITLWSLPEVR